MVLSQNYGRIYVAENCPFVMRQKNMANRGILGLQQSTSPRVDIYVICSTIKKCKSWCFFDFIQTVKQLHVLV